LLILTYDLVDGALSHLFIFILTMEKLMARSTGLQAKTINNKTVTNTCPICKGTKQFAIGSINAESIANLNITGGIQITDDCNHCDGKGSISHVIRVTKANKKRKMPLIVAKRVLV
jgi:predicted nucleic acid binding AN1-type Zn finger protein